MLEWVRRIARRARILAQIGENERSMDEEMRFHLEMEAAALQQEGLPPEEAWRRAHRAFGGVERFKEQGRDARGTRLIEDLWRDMRYAARQLRGSPGFAAATLLTLGLGIGATTMMMHTLGLSMPSEGSALVSPERLVYLGQGPTGCKGCVGMSAGNYLTVRDQVRSLEHLSMFAEWEPILRGAATSELTDGVQVTPDFFNTLQIRPMLGRTLVPDDSASDRQHVVVLKESMWRDRFSGDASVLGRTIVLDRMEYTIVGVVADEAAYPSYDADFWAPLVLTPAQASEREQADYSVVGRLHDDASVQSVTAEVGGIAGQVQVEFPDLMGGLTFAVTPLPELNRPSLDAVTLIFAVAVSLVFLIACINLAGLLIAKLSARRRELTVRRAMGAAPGRIARQLFAETILLAALGGAVGAVVAALGIRIVTGGTPPLFYGRGFAIALAMGLFSALLIGLWPAIRFARPRLAHQIREVTRTATGGVEAARVQRVLVIAQVALAIVLLSAAGLLARSFQKQYGIEPGFSTDRMLAVHVQNPPIEPEVPFSRIRLSDPGSATPADPERIDRLVRAIEAVPGVERAGAGLAIPFGIVSSAGRGRFEIEGQPPVLPDQRPSARRMQAVTSGYFDALGIPILRGRGFTDSDSPDAPRVAVINRVIAERFFPDDDPIGRGVIVDSLRWEIVGIVGSVFYGSTEELASPEIYRPIQQWGGSSRVWIAISTRGDLPGIGREVTAAIHRFDPDIAITRLLTMNTLRDNTMGSERRLLRLMGAFALAALLISAIGLYGLISYSVSQRTREFGVRLALGAERQLVLRLASSSGSACPTASNTDRFQSGRWAIQSSIHARTIRRSSSPHSRSVGAEVRRIASCTRWRRTNIADMIDAMTVTPLPSCFGRAAVSSSPASLVNSLESDRSPPPTSHLLPDSAAGSDRTRNFISMTLLPSTRSIARATGAATASPALPIVRHQRASLALSGGGRAGATSTSPATRSGAMSAKST
ncbi:MAG: FtsX-like permease family protein, partial [Gemmatimonas sp.]|nr:FtsX-like permease family protein [Gemmatimonas sp.]